MRIENHINGEMFDSFLLRFSTIVNDESIPISGNHNKHIDQPVMSEANCYQIDSRLVGVDRPIESNQLCCTILPHSPGRAAIGIDFGGPLYLFFELFAKPRSLSRRPS